MVHFNDNALRGAALGLVVLAAACGGSQTAPPISPDNTPVETEKPAGEKAASDAAVKAPGEAQIGDKAKCPVSGEAFTVTDQSPHSEIDGKTYYFCCSGCKEKFEKDPKKFLQST